MKEIKPVKRSKQLAPLSREHHDALMFIWKIKEGLKNGTPPAIISGYINWYWKNNLQNHFEQEEKLLLPHLPVNDDLAAQLKKEHETIRRLINKMDDSSATLLADTLNAHIRFEERQLFPHVERVVSTEQLNEIFGQLAHQPQCETQWSNSFWISRK
jgi:hemerythrin-like domain-containing protein